MSALICGAARVGETVVIALTLSEAKIGFEFYRLSPIAQRGIQDWIHELKKHEETLFPYLYAGSANGGRD
jgi:c-di-GMP-binding flagellar brake protein YcgR